MNFITINGNKGINISSILSRTQYKSLRELFEHKEGTKKRQSSLYTNQEEILPFLALLIVTYFIININYVNCKENAQ